MFRTAAALSARMASVSWRYQESPLLRMTPSSRMTSSDSGARSEEPTAQRSPWNNANKIDPAVGAGTYRFRDKWTAYRNNILKGLATAVAIGVGTYVYVNMSEPEQFEKLQQLPVQQLLVQYYQNSHDRRQVIEQLMQLAATEETADPVIVREVEQRLDQIEEQRIGIMTYLRWHLQSEASLEMFLQNITVFECFLMDLKDTFTNSPTLHIAAAGVVSRCCENPKYARRVVAESSRSVTELLNILPRPRTGRGAFHAQALAHVLDALNNLLALPTPNPAVAKFAAAEGLLTVVESYERERKPADLPPYAVKDQEHNCLLYANLLDTICLLAAEQPEIMGTIPLNAEQISLLIDAMISNCTKRLSMLPVLSPAEVSEVSEKACRAARIIQRLQNDNPATLQQLGKLLTAHQFYAEAALTLQLALEISPSPLIKFELAEILFQTSTAESQQQAFELYQELRDLMETSKHRGRPQLTVPPTSQLSLHRVLWQLAILHERADRLADAIEAVRASTRANPESLPSHLKLAALLLRGQPNRTQIESALQALSEAMRIAPENYNALLLLGRGHELLGQDDLAVAFWTRAAAKKDTSEPYRRIAAHFAKRGRLADAIAACRQIVVIEPADWEAVYELAGYAERLEGPQSIQRLQAFIEIVDIWSTILDTDPHLFTNNTRATTVLQELLHAAAVIGQRQEDDHLGLLGGALLRRLEGLEQQRSATETVTDSFQRYSPPRPQIRLLE